MEKGNLLMGYTQFGETVIGITKDNCVEKGMALLRNHLARRGGVGCIARLRMNREAIAAVYCAAIPISTWRNVETPEEMAAVERAIAKQKEDGKEFDFCGMPVYYDSSLPWDVSAMAIDVMEPEPKAA